MAASGMFQNTFRKRQQVAGTITVTYTDVDGCTHQFVYPQNQVIECGEIVATSTEAIAATFQLDHWTPYELE